MTDEHGESLRQARIGNHSAFRRLVEPHQDELRRHCYRMTGSIDDADDLVQETLFRAWRGLGSYVSHGSFRAWLYRIATNTTLNLLTSAYQRREVVNSAGEPSWLQPYPVNPSGTDPVETVEQLETVGLAFVVALQQLPGRQRAALLLCDVLGFTPAEAAETLSATTTATNSLLQRARAKMSDLDLPTHVEPDDEQTKLVEKLVYAWRTADTPALIKLLDPEAHLTMPPHELEVVGAATIVERLLDATWFAPHQNVQFLATRANNEHGFATYVRQAGSTEAAPHCIMLLGGATDTVTKITGFTEARIFDLLGLPKTMPANG